MSTDQGIAIVEAYLASVVHDVEAVGFYPRGLDRYPFDTIASSMMSKATALSRSSLALIRHEFADEAYGLSRSLVEGALILRYITAVRGEQPKRALEFVGFSFSYKNLWLDLARKAHAGTPMANEVEKYAKEWRLSGDPREAKRHWSRLRGFTWDAQNLTHPLDAPSLSASFKEGQYAVDYTALCQWVHCSQPALDNYVPREGAPFRFKKSSSEFANPAASTLYIILTYMHAVIGYALFGLGIQRPSAVDAAFSEALQNLPATLSS